MSQAYLGIDRFISDFDGGSRPTLYRISATVDGNPQKIQRLNFYAKAAALPGSTLGEIVVPYMGRQAKVPGDRTFEDWTITVINTEDFDIRESLEKWNRYYNGVVNNMVGDETGNNANITTGKFWGHVTNSSLRVEQFNRKGEVVMTYLLIGAFPKEVASMELGYDQYDTISEFQVTFAYQYFQANHTGKINQGGKI
jgi:hypothetical protein